MQSKLRFFKENMYLGLLLGLLILLTCPFWFNLFGYFFIPDYAFVNKCRGEGSFCMDNSFVIFIVSLLAWVLDRKASGGRKSAYILAAIFSLILTILYQLNIC